MSKSSANSSQRSSLIHRHESVLFGAILVVLLLTTLLDTQHNYYHNTWTSAVDITRQTSMLGIFALGAAIVIIAGGIDLSSGSVIAFSGTTCATIMLLLAPEEMIGAQPVGLGVIMIAITGTLFVGFLIGSLHAWLITTVGLPPFVATLATLVGLRSFSRAIVENITEAVIGAPTTQIQIFDSSFRYLATSVWIPAALFIGLAALCWLLLSRTVTGRHLYALGGNEQAARLSGIQTDRLKWLAYCLSAILSSIAGIIYIAEESVADPQTLGRGYELNAIAAAVVGGCSLQGGIGTIPGTLLGALFLRSVIDGVAKVIKTGADVYEGLIVGCVVVFAVAFSQTRTQSRGMRFFAGPLGLVTILNLSILAAALAALIGPTFLGSLMSLLRLSDAHLEATHLAALAGFGTLALLMLARSRTSSRWRARLTVVLAVCLVVGASVYNAALPGLRYQAAIDAISTAGGTMEKVHDGTAADFTATSLDDATLKKIAGRLEHLTDLVELRLASTRVTDEGLLAVKVLRTLRRLDVSNTSVTAARIRQLKRTVPNLDVTR